MHKKRGPRPGIIDKFLTRFCASRPTRVIELGGKPYLYRVYLWHWRGYRFYLHRFATADGDRWLHDHPFHGFSVVLSGGYIEERMMHLDLPSPKTKLVGVRFFNWIRANTFHRIATVRPRTWTLFCHTPHFKEWGFFDSLITADGSRVLGFTNPYANAKEGRGSHWWERAPKFQEVFHDFEL